MYNLIDESHSECGTLEFESEKAARAFADLELRALSLRGTFPQEEWQLSPFWDPLQSRHGEVRST